MDPRQRRIKEIFSDALELQEPERSQFLLRVCDDDVSLRTDVEKLLSSFEQSGDFLQASLGSFLFANTEIGSTLVEGDVIAGRFRIVRLIGSGGMGEVYEAEDAQRGEPVAIKTLRRQYMLSPELHARFRREIHLARKISHENICEIYHFGSDRIRDTDVEYVTMKLLRGVTLAQRLQSGPMQPAEVKRIVEQVANGLAALHEHGIIHRDLKPANIILTPGESGEQAVITDFGLAQSFAGGEREETLTVSGQLLGTPPYMAPEQLTGGASGPETDIYALGVVMYQMLTGRRPFEAKTIFEAAQKLAEKPEPLGAYVDIGRDWERIIARCLERERSARFHSASEFLKNLRKLSVHRRRWLRIPRKRSRRNRIFSYAAFKQRPVLVSTIAAAIAAMIAPVLIPPVRASILRRGCAAFPGTSLLCQLPADPGMAVLPFDTSASSNADQALAIGTSRFIRESLARLAPDPNKLCVHLRTDRLAEGVGLVLEGKIRAMAEGVEVQFFIRESRAASAAEQPLLVRRMTRFFRRDELPDLGPRTMLILGKALGVDFPPAEWSAWTRSVPRSADSIAAYLSGLGWLESEAPEEAVKAFNSAIDPTRSFDFALAHTGLGDAFRSLFSRTKDPGWALRARQAYQRAIPLDSSFGFAGAEKSLAELEVAASEPESAITRFRTALKLWPNDQAGQKRLASVLESRGRVDEAVAVLDQAVRQTPRCWLTHNSLASLYSRHGRLREAEASLLQVVKLAPFNATAYHNLAFDYLKLSRSDDAVEMSSKAVQLRPTPLAFSTLGRAFLQKGCSSDALINLREAVNRDPQSFVVWANLANALHELQPQTSYAAASSVRTAELSGKALETSTPNYALAASQRGLNLARAGRGGEAVAYLTKARDYGSADANVLLTVAEGFDLIGQRQAAFDALASALGRDASPQGLRGHAGLRRLVSEAQSAGVLARDTAQNSGDAGGLITQHPAGCPGWHEPGRGLQVN